jgi:hypothetical protein
MLTFVGPLAEERRMTINAPADRLAGPSLVGLSHASESGAAGREAVRTAIAGRSLSAEDIVILFAGADYDIDALYRAAVAQAAPARVLGCTTSGAFTDIEQVPHGCVAALVQAEQRSFGVCHVVRDDLDIAGSARRAAETARQRAGNRHPHSVLLLLTDGLTPDQREIARGAYEVSTAVIPFVGGAAGDSLNWERTSTFGDGRVLPNGIVAVWINSARPMGVGVDHGWRPAGKPMLVTRAEGTVVHELDGTPALDAYLTEQGGALDRNDPEFFRAVMGNPVGLPNARGRYDVRQLHAYLPAGGGINFNVGVSEQSILQVMSADGQALVDGARRAAQEAVGQLQGPARLALVFACGSRVPLLGDRVRDEVAAISSALHGASVCGFYTFGEFARTTGSSGVHNSSVAVLVL